MQDTLVRLCRRCPLVPADDLPRVRLLARGWHEPVPPGARPTCALRDQADRSDVLGMCGLSSGNASRHLPLLPRRPSASCGLDADQCRAVVNVSLGFADDCLADPETSSQQLSAVASVDLGCPGSMAR